MGLCISAAGGEGASRVTKLKGTLCVALCGVGGSGKSTFAKQMKILYLSGFEQEELESYRNIIRRNFLLSIQEQIKRSEELGVNEEIQGENLKQFRYFKTLSIYDIPWDDKLVTKLKALYMDPAMVKTRADTNWRPQIKPDYLTDNFDRLTQENYVPSQEDILFARFRTTGQVTTTFVKDKWKWELVDLGGQESEREKWEEIFGLVQVNAVIYMVALDEFDVASVEDPSISSLEVSMQIFKQVMSDLKKDVARILFLNKKDLFVQKMSQEGAFEKFKKKFPQYQGENNTESMQNFVRELFLKLLDDSVTTLQTHYTCALDTKAIEVVFDAVRSSIMVSRLTDMGMVL